ncbi:LysM peptidoglycan-binding domain-containing protein [Colwellia sp. M166]|uniref:LysM peptidoglycan-binding domain-containing protein n=1 Tax=Colwellia sp. M166 TaxID=2583805 RepID=UPI00211F05C1|nr:LysM peptidoglycan-binding domain-containing protein [Colwellia sp. M166]UUO23780.1 LysM peptidoglycan-binding domain-containing protein [Colwellia sp. M166]|tara:strand:- start:10736 stop:11824 length:1089 start_codon:yes stop_codon:yes gene_type:complete
MLIKIFSLILGIFMSLSLLADELTLKPDAPKSYIVKKGDTLWDISGVFLNQAWLWPKLWRLNPEINNPHLIYPGDELRLVFDAQGQPMLVKGKPKLKWSPKVRKQSKNQTPVSTLPLQAIAPYIRYDSVKTLAELERFSYIIGSEKGYKSSLDGFKAYVNSDLVVGQSYAIYHKGTVIIDPATAENLGYNIILVGTGKALQRGNISKKQPGTLYISGVKREIHSGAFVVPVNDEQQYPAVFTMRAGAKNTKGLIINSVTELREFAKFDVVMINQGAKQALQAGDVLTVSRKSPAVIDTDNGPEYTHNTSRWNRMGSDNHSDYDMPTESIGQVMVFKVYDKVSMALILHSDKALRVLDGVIAP